MKIKFWGVRGSIACPGTHTTKYGGNTLCIELRFEDPPRLIIVDAGTGLRGLGDYLMAHDLSKGPLDAEIFVTHTHWDHIQGFPFFTPMYVPGTKLKVYGPVTYEEDALENVLGGQWIYRYFPVRYTDLASEIEYIDLKEGRFELGDGIMVTTKYLNHPLLCLGYRFEYRGKVLCTAFDTEPFRNIFCTDPNDPSYDEAVASEGEKVAQEENQRLEEFFAGADLLIHDGQYTLEEYETSKIGWGHSACEHAIAAARRARVKRLALIHHDPMRTDSQLDVLETQYRSPEYAGETETFFAREGLEIKL